MIFSVLCWMSQTLSSKLQTGLYMYRFKQGTHLALQHFLVPRGIVLLIAFFTLVLALCRSFTRFTRVVVGFLLTIILIILTTWGETLRWSKNIRDFISILLCLPLLINCSHSWFPYSKLCTYCRFSSPSLVGLQFGFWCPLTALWFKLQWSLECDSLRFWTRVFYSDNKFKQVS